MYNILLIYQIGVDVSTHPMVLSVPVQFSLTNTHRHTNARTLMKYIVPRCTRTCASERERAPSHTFMQSPIRTRFVGERVRMRARAMLDFDFHFSFFQVWNDKSVSQNRKLNTFMHKLLPIHATSQSQCREMVPKKFCFRKKIQLQQPIICQGNSQFANKIVFFHHLRRINSKIRVALIHSHINAFVMKF